MDLRNPYFVIRNSARFAHRKAGTEHPSLPDPRKRSHEIGERQKAGK